MTAVDIRGVGDGHRANVGLYLIVHTRDTACEPCDSGQVCLRYCGVLLEDELVRRSTRPSRSLEGWRIARNVDRLGRTAACVTGSQYHLIGR